MLVRVDTYGASRSPSRPVDPNDSSTSDSPDFDTMRRALEELTESTTPQKWLSCPDPLCDGTVSARGGLLVGNRCRGSRHTSGR